MRKYNEVSMTIFIEENDANIGELRETMEKAAERAVELEGLPASGCQLSVTFVSPEEIHELNRDYRGVDRVTDVLSFPQYEPDDLVFYSENPEETPDELMIGDVVICLDKAEAQAEEYGHSLERELIYLFTHSVLHLLGYDHEEDEDKKVMRAREEEIMDWLGIPRMQA
jgi:probable rRNA maturation factor